MLINKTKLRRTALILANEMVPECLPNTYVDTAGREWDYSRVNKMPKKQYTQVCPEFFDTMEAKVLNMLKAHIKSMPPGGKTIK
tara:strand:- start:25 stop:276 length:252 start_codon:yes stop_codon:yes gene_type:complete